MSTGSGYKVTRYKLRFTCTNNEITLRIKIENEWMWNCGST